MGDHRHRCVEWNARSVSDSNHALAVCDNPLLHRSSRHQPQRTALIFFNLIQHGLT